MAASLCRPAKLSRSSSLTSEIMTRSKTRSESEGSIESSNACWWGHLPDEALIRVYNDLDDNDRASTALVCKQWNAVFTTASLWRHRHFLFAGSHVNDVSEKACSCINQVGPSLRNLILECGQPDFYTAEPIADALTSFLAHVVGSPRMNIVSFRVMYLDCVHSWKYFDSSRGKLVDALVTFLKNQEHLESLDMSGSHFRSTEGVALLDAITQSKSIRTISFLNIRDMFEPRYQAYRDGRFRGSLGRYVHLQQLYLNYNYLNEDILSGLCTSGKSYLRYLRVLVYSTESFSHTIAPWAWREFSESCRDAKVGVYVVGNLAMDDYKRLFVRCVPMHGIDILSWDLNLSESNAHLRDIPRVVRHVSLLYPALGEGMPRYWPTQH